MRRLTTFIGQGLAICVSGMLLLAANTLAAVEPAAADKADARVLVDVSGSMKENDPQNLRRPALRLLVGLLPPDTQAGVWLFDQAVNSLVPLGQVNDAWKKRARAGANEIHSRGLFTHIEAALAQSTKDWVKPDPGHRRHVILLTDGMVDVSKDAAESAASRARILKDLLPRLKAQNTQVHTIALSERADHELMKELADSTGGWYEQVDDAERLQRVFLRIFEKVGKPDAVPLKGNSFKIDKSITEVTLLVFRGSGEKTVPTRITTPKKKTFSMENAPANVSWNQDEGYDLLTIKNPQAGTWHIQAKEDPDNRVMVVTDLQMEATEVPSFMALGERLPLSVHFTNEGELITKEAFLRRVDIKAEHQVDGKPGEPKPLYDDGEEGDVKEMDSHFGALLGEGLQLGEAELIITAEGKTFVREQRRMFRVRMPAKLEVTNQIQNGIPGVYVRLVPDRDVIQLDGIEPQAWLPGKKGARLGLILLPEGGGVWGNWLDTTTFSGARDLRVNLVAVSQGGNPVELDLEPVAIQGVGSAKPKKEVTKAPKDPKPPAAEEPKTAEEENGLVTKLVLFGVGNLVLIGLAVGGYFYWRRRKEQRLVKLVGEEEPTQEADAEADLDADLEADLEKKKGAED